MGNLKKELVSGVFYTSLAKYSSIAVQIVVTAILARLLTPSDYGVVAIATVFIVFFNLLSDIGIGPAIIQFKDLSTRELSQIFSFTFYIGIAISLLFFLCSWLIAEYYNNRLLIPVCQLLSVTILFHCLNIVPLNIQYKKKRFKFMAVVTLFSQIITAVIAVILALLSFGVYALAIQQILSVLILFSIVYLQEKLPFTFKIDKAPLKKIMSFSIYQFLFNIINYFSRNMDKILIGRFIGLAPLGQYEKSYRLMLMPLQNITFAVTPVMQPLFSNYQNDLNEMAEKYKKLFTFLCYIGFPLSILLFFTGKELVLLFFGNQWYDAIFPFRIMALTVGLQILNGTAGSIYQSANATKQLFVSGCWCAFFMITSFTIAIWGWKSINAVAIGFAIAQLLNSAQTYLLLFRTIKYPLRNILTTMIYPLIVTLLIGVSVFCVHTICDDIHFIISLFFKTLVALMVWYFSVNGTGPYKGIVSRFYMKIIIKIKQ
jgi:PST family polysaccharide transporter